MPQPSHSDSSASTDPESLRSQAPARGHAASGSFDTDHSEVAALSESAGERPAPTATGTKGQDTEGNPGSESLRTADGIPSDVGGATAAGPRKRRPLGAAGRGDADGEQSAVVVPGHPGATAAESGAENATGGRFSRILALSGWAFVPLGLFARLPLAMLNVGVLTLVTAVSHSYAIGGFAAGAAGVGSAMGAPLLGFAADRIGQKPVLITAALINTVFLAVVIALSYAIAGSSEGFTPSATAMVLAAAWLAGASSPQVGPLARARWMALVRKIPEAKREGALDTALSYESTADEFTFVLGPALVGIAAALIAPWLPLLIAAVLTSTLVSAFAVHRTVSAVSPQRGGKIAPEVRSEPGRWLWLKVSLPVLGMLCMGTFFGSTLTSLSAFTGTVGAEAGGSELAGLLYAVMGLSSAAAALSVAFWPRAFAQRWRWVVLAAGTSALACLLLLPTSIGGMVLALLLLGLPVGPTMVTIFSIGGLVAPKRWLGTVMTALASGIVAGTAIGSSISGSLAQAEGYHQAFLVPVAAAAVLLLLGTVTALVLRPSRQGHLTRPGHAARPGHATRLGGDRSA